MGKAAVHQELVCPRSSVGTRAGWRISLARSDVGASDGPQPAPAELIEAGAGSAFLDAKSSLTEQ